MDFVARRRRLLEEVKNPVLLAAGAPLSRNYPANTWPFRADSNFLYFFDTPEPDSAAFLDPATGKTTLFVPRRSVEDALWHGELESFEKVKDRQRVDAVLPVEELEERVRELCSGRPIDAVALSDPKWTARLRNLVRTPLRFEAADQMGPTRFTDVLAKLRLKKDADELAQMKRTAAVTHEAHVAAMKASAVGVTEQELAGIVEGTFARAGCTTAYQTILSVRGEVLHNHHHLGTLRKGDIVLLDGGAEALSGYCSDVTRCWPVGGGFSQFGREIYQLVLDAQLAAIAAVKPGVRYRDLHLLAAKVMTRGLVELGLMEGSVDGLVESGAHAVFFPHGVGHQIGLDVHDLETLGDRIHYPNGRTRSSQFGTAYLRMDMDLEEGMTFTIEPGLYFVPAILASAELRERFKTQVRFDRATEWLKLNEGRGFGGIRIEDDVLVTESSPDVLTGAIPKSIPEIETLRAEAHSR